MLPMKIRHPWLIKATAFTAALVVRSWMGTLRFQYRPVGPDVDPLRPGLEGRYIYVFWHENLLLPMYRYSRANIWAIISQHADGELVTAVSRYFGLHTVRGSSTRGGIEATRQLLRHGRDCHLALTPDGPRGPRRRVQTGVVYLAARTGLPIVPAGIGYERPWRLHSWDRFAIPRPWSFMTLVLGTPIPVPESCDRAEREYYRRLVEERLLQVSETAETWADTGHYPAAQEPPALAG
jgi:lysophospholipid acyltransferase (LPLAT)-like uncharacterized protein